MSTLMSTKHRSRPKTPGTSVYTIWSICGIPLYSSTCGNGFNAVSTKSNSLRKQSIHRLRPSPPHSLTVLPDRSSKALLRVGSSKPPGCQTGLYFLAGPLIQSIRSVCVLQDWYIIDPSYRQGHLFCMNEIKRFCKSGFKLINIAHILCTRPSVVVKIVRPGVIIELSNLNGIRLAHVLRLEHATCTPMGELAHPKELVLVPHCDDVSMDNLRGLLVVEYIGSTLKPPVGGTSFFIRYVKSSGGHSGPLSSYRYLYDFIEDHALLDLDPLWNSERTCLACSNSSKSKKRTYESELWYHFSNEVPSLAAFDAFSGAGGLSAGLVKSGATTCRYAVEIEESVACTFQ